MSESKNFRKQFWKEKKTVGAMAPSSRFLTEKMLQHIDFKSAKVIIELGPGTGVFTDAIISRMRNDATLLVFEVNDSFFDNLHKKVKDKRVHHDSAEKLQEYLQKYGFEKADVVVSSLPLAVFPPQLRNNILTASEQVLIPSGKYIQFQYSLQAKSLLKKLYKDVKIAFTPFNLPPAFVYTCTKKNAL